MKIKYLPVASLHSFQTVIREEVAKYGEIVDADFDTIVVVSFTYDDKGNALLDVAKLMRELYPDKEIVAWQHTAGVNTQYHRAMRALGIKIFHPRYAGVHDHRRVFKELLTPEYSGFVEEFMNPDWL